MSDRYYISTGDKGCYYTLRYTFTEQHQVRSDNGRGEIYTVERDYHIRNLSIDAREAIAKAKEITGQELTVNFDVNDIAKAREIDWSVLQGGKHAGKSIHELRETEEGKGYLCWLAENCGSVRSYAKTVELVKSLLAHELGERSDARDAEKQAKAEAAAVIAAKLEPIAKVIAEQVGNFCASIASDMRHGQSPRGRAISLVIDIYAKAHGRRNSKAYAAAYRVASDILEDEPSTYDPMPTVTSPKLGEWNARHGYAAAN